MKKNKNFNLILVGLIISLFGSAIQRFSLSLYLLELTGSAATFANILAISMLPYILFAPLAGSLADRVNRKKIMVWLDFISSAIMLGYGIILFQGKDHALVIGTVMFLLATTYTLYTPAVTAALPQIVSGEELVVANGKVQQVGSLANFLGPILAGILYSALGIKVIVIINGLSFFLSAIMELFIQIPDISQKVLEKLSYRRALAEMKESYVYLSKERKVILCILYSYGLCNIFINPIFSVVAPYFIKVQLGLSASIYGVAEGIIAAGMILGGVIISRKSQLFPMKKIGKIYGVMVIAVGVMVISSISFIGPWASIVLFTMGGFIIMVTIAISNVVSLTFTQMNIPLHMQGKVSALSTALATISIPPGQLIYGYFIEVGWPLFIILLMTTFMNIGVALFVKWNIKRIDERYEISC